jgi:dTDP-4-dehydrorhamnose reductase
VSAPLRIALIGAKAQVAVNLARVLPTAGFDLTVLARPVFELPIRSPPRSSRLSRTYDQSGAHTAVDRAEDEPDLAYAINRDAAGAIATAAAEAGAAIIHYSTDWASRDTRPMALSVWPSNSAPASELIRPPSNPPHNNAAFDSSEIERIMATFCRHRGNPRFQLKSLLHDNFR